MQTPGSSAAQTAAIVSLKRSVSAPETKVKTQKSDVRAMPSGQMERNPQGEDTEMVDADLTEFSRKAPISGPESVVTAMPPLGESRILLKKSCIITAVIANPHSEHRQILGVVPQIAAADLRTKQHLEKEIDEPKEAPQLVPSENKKLEQEIIPAYATKYSQLVSKTTNPNSKRLKCSAKQVDEWRSFAGTIDDKARTVQRQLDNTGNDGKKIYDESNKRNEQIHHLDSHIDGRKNSRERLEATRVLSDENDSLIQQREDLIQQRANLMKSCNELGQAFQQLEKRFISSTGENQILQEELSHHKEAAQRAILENRALRERIDEQELSVTKAQSAAMSVLSNSLSAVLPDDRIRKRFSELFESVAEWARENAAAPDQAVLAHPDNILRWQKDGLLRQIGPANSTPNLNFNLQDDTAVDTLLNAAVARYLCQDFFQSPFWFAEESSPISDVSIPRDERFDTTVVLDLVLKKMMKHHDGDEAKVHAWRASTVQTLASSDKARKRLSASYRHYLENKLLPRCGKLVRSPLPQSDRDELTDIIKSFGNFAIELWSQKTLVRCLCLESFENKVYQAGRYMEIARAVGIEEGDVKLNGRSIPVVVQPLILGLGTHDGKDYNKSRVWSRAVVWVSKDVEATAKLTAKPAAKPVAMPASVATQTSRMPWLFRKW